jgi:hypothetical protein
MEVKAIKLLGNRIYLELPPQEEKSKLIVDENTKEALVREMAKKLSKLTVFAVGDTVSIVSVGDVVQVDPAILSRAPLISLSDDKQVILISVFDVIHIWNKIEE